MAEPRSHDHHDYPFPHHCLHQAQVHPQVLMSIPLGVRFSTSSWTVVAPPMRFGNEGDQLGGHVEVEHKSLSSTRRTAYIDEKQTERCGQIIRVTLTHGAPLTATRLNKMQGM